MKWVVFVKGASPAQVVKHVGYTIILWASKPLLVQNESCRMMMNHFLACLHHFGGMDPKTLSNILLMAIVTICSLVCWVCGKGYILRNPDDDLFYCRCDLFEVPRMITCLWCRQNSQIIAFFYS